MSKRENLGNVQTHGMFWRLPKEEEGGLNGSGRMEGDQRFRLFHAFLWLSPNPSYPPNCPVSLVNPVPKYLWGSLFSVPWDPCGPPEEVRSEMELGKGAQIPRRP